MPHWLEQGLNHGAALSVAMTALIFGSLFHDPRIWSRSLPPDAKALAGPPPPESERRRRAWSVGLVLILLGVFGHLVSGVGGSGVDAFLSTFGAAWVCFQVFNLVDAVLIDLPLVALKPRFARIPGTENAAGFRDPRWHLRNYFAGFAGGFPFALLVAALGQLFGLLSG